MAQNGRGEEGYVRYVLQGPNLNEQGQRRRLEGGRRGGTPTTSRVSDHRSTGYVLPVTIPLTNLKPTAHHSDYLGNDLLLTWLYLHLPNHSHHCRCPSSGINIQYTSPSPSNYRHSRISACLTRLYYASLTRSAVVPSCTADFLDVGSLPLPSTPEGFTFYALCVIFLLSISSTRLKSSTRSCLGCMVLCVS